MTGRVLVGIAGWSYPDWKGVVYPAGCKDTLQFCARYVDLIEINSTFYRPPQVAHTTSWAKRIEGTHTLFTAKVPRTFTHDLDFDPAVVAETREGFTPLRDAGLLRALLLQFSYRFTAEDAHRHHLARLTDAFESVAPIVVEVRHKSWAQDQAVAFLRDLDVSVAQLDYPGSQSGFGLWSTRACGPSSLAYLRLHGRNYGAWFKKDAGRDEVYDYDYSQRELDQIARRTDVLAEEAAEVVVVGNNHYRGQGMKVAVELMSRLGRTPAVPELLREAYPDLAVPAAD